MKTTLRKISEALHREERRAGQKIGYVITVKYPKNTRKEYIKALGIGKCRINVPEERKAVKSKKKSGTGFKEVMDKEMEKLHDALEADPAGKGGMQCLQKRKQ